MFSLKTEDDTNSSDILTAFQNDCQVVESEQSFQLEELEEQIHILSQNQLQMVQLLTEKQEMINISNSIVDELVRSRTVLQELKTMVETYLNAERSNASGSCDQDQSSMDEMIVSMLGHSYANPNRYRGGPQLVQGLFPHANIFPFGLGNTFFSNGSPSTPRLHPFPFYGTTNTLFGPSPFMASSNLQLMEETLLNFRMDENYVNVYPSAENNRGAVQASHTESSDSNSSVEAQHCDKDSCTTVLFEAHASLICHVDEEWVKRGQGTIKIVSNDEKDKTKLVMTANQTSEVLLDHFITANMNLHFENNLGTASSWILEYTEDDISKSKIQFESSDVGMSFKNIVDSCIGTTNVGSSCNELSALFDSSVEDDDLQAALELVENDLLNCAVTEEVDSCNGNDLIDGQNNSKDSLAQFISGGIDNEESDEVFGHLNEWSNISFENVSVSDFSAFHFDDNFEGFPDVGQTIFDMPNTDQLNSDLELQECNTNTNELLLFEDKAKLFRFDSSTKQWVERGVGCIRILRDPQTNISKILMHRNSVYKVCANHRILPEMKLELFASNKKVWTWLAKDYSDESVREEIFAARFRREEMFNKFKDIFDECAVIARTVKKSLINDESVYTSSYHTSSTCPSRNLSSSSQSETDQIVPECVSEVHSGVEKAYCCQKLQPLQHEESALVVNLRPAKFNPKQKHQETDTAGTT